MAQGKVKAPDAAAQLGLEYQAKGDAALRKAFKHLPEMGMQAGIKHVMAGALAGRPLLAFEASYMFFAGQVPVVVAYTIYAVEAPPWPLTHVTPRSFLSRLLLRLGRSRDLMLDDPEFNRCFRVKAHDENFAIALLGPEMQRFMVEKRTMRWRVGHGQVCMLYSGNLKPARIEASLARFEAFWALVPPELEAW